MRELDDLLPTLQPPDGGLARLQRRVASKEKHQHRFRTTDWAWVATACVTLAVTAVFIQPWVARRQRAHALAVALRAAMMPDQPSSGIRVVDGAAIQLPSGQANVRLYLVQTASPTTGDKQTAR